MNGVSIGLAGLTMVAFAFIPFPIAQLQSQPFTAPPPQVSPDLEAVQPQRLTITVSVVDPSDLKVEEGQEIQTGDLIADRGRERSRLESQKQQLELALERLRTATISQPLPPAAAPVIAQLPSTSYLEQEAAVERAKVTVEQAERAIALKQQEIVYLQQLEHLNPLVLEHEQAVLETLQQQHDGAVRDYQLAVGQLNTAQEFRAYQEYEYSLDAVQRVEAQNQVDLEYQQQRAAYEQRLRDRDYQVSQTQLKLDEVNNAIATLAVIRAPYAGLVRRIQWLGQDSSGALSAEITMLVPPGDSRDSTLPGEQPGVSEPAH